MSEPDARRRLPQVERLARLLDDRSSVPRPIVTNIVRTVLDVARKRARRTKTVPTEAELVAMCADALARREREALQPVINATGVVLHTNLGRAPLSQSALDAVAETARGYSNLELDLEHGRRGDRYVHVEPLLASLAGAQAALVVNNNAAAVLLVCSALASGRQVVISRGELIEIGGEFRIPEVLGASGATLHEVGTTNKTHIRDYERAIGEDTAFVLKVHPSNYRVVGFTAAPQLDELATLAHRRGVPLVYDVGSGLVGRTFADEPRVDAAIADGCDLVCFSGDKLFGGPQAGIVVGNKELVDRLRMHPLVRALRPDKMQLAALAATVTSYLDGSADTLPVWQMLDADPALIAQRAERLAAHATDAGYEADVAQSESVPGGGSLPGHGLPTAIVRLRAKSLTASDLSARLRAGAPPVICRVEDGYVVLDLRTVPPDQDDTLTTALHEGL